MTKKKSPQLSPEQATELLAVLKARFEKHAYRHHGLDWQDVQARLEAQPDTLWSLSEMERTGGEPDVIGQDAHSGEYCFCDCVTESPKGRRSLCYDHEARVSRKEHPPQHSAVEMAAAMGVELLNEAQYRELQALESCDLKTSSWIETPADIRQRDGALFGDRRYGHVFVYHNGAASYYAARGFRGLVRV